MEGLALDEDKFKSIARLPARDVLDGQLAGVVASPLTGLVRGLGSMIQGLALQLGQIAEKGLVTGEAPPRPRSRAAEDSSEEPAAEADARRPPRSEPPRPPRTGSRGARRGPPRPRTSRDFSRTTPTRPSERRGRREDFETSETDKEEEE